MSLQQKTNLAYGLTQALIPTYPNPIIANRVPGTTDFAQLATVWIIPTINAAYMLTSAANNVATWTILSNGGGGGVFTSLTVTPGPISLTGTTTINTAGAAATTIGTGGTGAVNIGNATGNTAVTGAISVSGSYTSTNGDITLTNGTLTAGGDIVCGTNLTVEDDINVTSGNIEVAAGDITADIGDIIATAGAVNAGTSMSAGTTITAGTGISTTVGNIVADAGNITATLGGITANAGNIIATLGDLRAGGNLELLGAGSQIVFAPGPVITSGAGAPAGVAPQGSLYLRTNGAGVNERAYIATDSIGGWTAIVTAT